MSKHISAVERKGISTPASIEQDCDSNQPRLICDQRNPSTPPPSCADITDCQEFLDLEDAASRGVLCLEELSSVFASIRTTTSSLSRALPEIVDLTHIRQLAKIGERIAKTNADAIAADIERAEEGGAA